MHKCISVHVHKCLRKRASTSANVQVLEQVREYFSKYLRKCTSSLCTCASAQVLATVRKYLHEFASAQVHKCLSKYLRKCVSERVREQIAYFDKLEIFQMLHYKSKITVVFQAKKKRRSNVVLMLG